MLRHRLLLLCFTVFCFYNTVQGQFTLDDSLQLYYPFSGNANDASGNGINGSVTGASLTPDRFGNSNSAYYFDGNSDYIQTFASFDDPYHTISVWFRGLDSTGSGNSAKTFLVQDAASLTYGTFFGRFADNDLRVKPGGGNQFSHPENIDTASWHHLVLIRDGSTQSYYLDGVLQGSSASGTTGSTTFQNVNLVLGCGRQIGTQYFHGYLDEVRVYNRTLSECEISQLYCTAAPCIDVSDTTITAGTHLSFNNLNTNYDSTAWLLNGNLVSNDSLYTHQFITPGVYQLVVYSEDSNCSMTDTVMITVLPEENCLLVNTYQKVSDTEGSFNAVLSNSDGFGGFVESIGDIDNDGNPDLAVSAIYDDDGASNSGAVYILMPNPDGTIERYTKISSDSGSFGSGLSSSDEFGRSISLLGDLDGDGHSDIVVGSPKDDDGGSNRGCAWILFLDSTGNVLSKQKISSTQGSFGGSLSNEDRFGTSVLGVPDINGDGIQDLIVGSNYSDAGGSNSGSIWVIYLNTNGTVQDEFEISNTSGNLDFTIGANWRFGSALGYLGQIYNGSSFEILVGSPGGTTATGNVDGAVFLLSIDSTGVVATTKRISEGLNGFNANIQSNTRFGVDVSDGKDVDGDGYPEILISNWYHDETLTNDGAAWLLSIDSTGYVFDYKLIASGVNGFTETLDNSDQFGFGSEIMDDLNGDGILELAIGARNDDDGGSNRGAMYILNLKDSCCTAKSIISQSDTAFSQPTSITFTNLGNNADSIAWELDGALISNDSTFTYSFSSLGHYELILYTKSTCISRDTTYIRVLPDSNCLIANSASKISDISGGFSGALSNATFFGSSIARYPDINNDGIDEIIVGAHRDNDGATSAGAVYFIRLDAAGNSIGHHKISSDSGNFGSGLSANDYFGQGLDVIGDINGDGIEDIAVGAPYDDDGGQNRGAIWILILDTNGNVSSKQKISDTQGGFSEPLANNERFGSSITGIGDLNNDGVPDIAVGHFSDNVNTYFDGSLVILYMNSNGTVNSEVLINRTNPLLANLLENQAYFGIPEPLGDLNGDGISEFAVGAAHYGSLDYGEVLILSIDSSGSLIEAKKLSENGFNETISNFTHFGGDISFMGDIDGDGYIEIAVGGWQNNAGGSQRGAVWIISLDSNAYVFSATKISSLTASLSGYIDDQDKFGKGLANIGDFNNDGYTDLAVGASFDDDGGSNRGSVYLLQIGDSCCISSVIANQKDTAISMGESISFSIIGSIGNSIGWYMNGSLVSNDTSFSYSFDSLGYFAIVLTTNSTCVSHDTVYVHVLPEELSCAEYNGYQKISALSGDFTGDLDASDFFTYDMTSIGDFFNDGSHDVAIGTPFDDDGGNSRGAVYILDLGPNGKVEHHVKISSDSGGFGSGLVDGDAFGFAVALIGDLNNDGVEDLAVGTAIESDSSAVWILFMDSTGEVDSKQKISPQSGNFNGIINSNSAFGASVCKLGDLDGDGNEDILVGARGDAGVAGTLWVLFLNSDGTVAQHQKISSDSGSLGFTYGNNDLFGKSCAFLGDVNNDGYTEVAVGSPNHDENSTNDGAIYILSLNSNGTVHNSYKVSDGNGGFTGSLSSSHLFGWSISDAFDFEQDGIYEIIVGAPGASDGGSFTGSYYQLSIGFADSIIQTEKFSNTTTTLPFTVQAQDYLGYAADVIKDVNQDNVPDLIIGAIGDDDGGSQVGAAYVIFGFDSCCTAVSDINLPDTAIDIGTTLSFSNTGSNGDSIAWYINDSLVSNDTSLSYSFDSLGYFEIILVTSSTCISRDTVYVHVLPENLDCTKFNSAQKISAIEGEFTGGLGASDQFGRSVSSVGDFFNDGTHDVIVGAHNDDDGGSDRGAIYLLDIGPNGQVQKHIKISSDSGGFGTGLSNGNHFGTSVASIGDLNNDGIIDLAVGAPETGQEGVWILFMDSTGQVDSKQKISSSQGGFTGSLSAVARFGSSICKLGDLDGDGNEDIMVGSATSDFNSISGVGAVWVLFLNSNGTVASHQKISSDSGSLDYALHSNERFGSSCAFLGDINNDGRIEVAVGASNHNENESGEGAIYILSLNSNGIVHNSVIISEDNGGFTSALAGGDSFGASISDAIDFDQDGISEIIVGAPGNDNGASGSGAFYKLSIGFNNQVVATEKFSNGSSNLSFSLSAGDAFGSSVDVINDVNQDNVPDIIVGAEGDDDGSANVGAAYIIFGFDSCCTANSIVSIQDTAVEIGTSLTFTNIGSNGDSIAWIFNDSIVSFDTSFTYAFNEFGEFELVLFTGSTCYSRDTVTITVFPPNSCFRTGYISPIGNELGSFGSTIPASSRFGWSVESIQDFNGDGTEDIAVGVPNLGGSSTARGGLYLVYLDPQGDAVGDQLISSSSGSFGSGLDVGDLFGSDIARIGDLNNDGVIDLAVGAPNDDDGDANAGAVWILFMDSSGHVGTRQKISQTAGGFADTLEAGDKFGGGIAGIGDLNLDGTEDILVGSFGFNSIGAAWILFLNSNGTVHHYKRLGPGVNPFNTNINTNADFGHDCAYLGDVDGDGNIEVAVSAFDYNGATTSQGAFWTINLDTGGNALDYSLFTGSVNGLPAMGSLRGFAQGLSSAIEYHDYGYMMYAGAPTADDGGTNRGALHEIKIGYGDSALYTRKYSSTSGGLATSIQNAEQFGAAVEWIGDINQDLVPDFVVGSPFDGAGKVQIIMGQDTCCLAESIINIDDTAFSDPSTLTFENVGYNADSIEWFLDGTVVSAGDSFTYTFSNLGSYQIILRTTTECISRDTTYINVVPEDNCLRIESTAKISDTAGNFNGVLANNDLFGQRVKTVGDLNQDGVPDLAVGSVRDNDGGAQRGAIYLLYMNDDGTVHHHSKISSDSGGFGSGLSNGDQFGRSISQIGDLNNDGIDDFVAGVPLSDDGGNNRGGVWILFMDSTGNVDSKQKISDISGSFSGTLANNDQFGHTVLGVPDINGDGVDDIIVGAHLTDDGNTDAGAIWVLFMTANGLAPNHQKISNTAGNLGITLDEDERFGADLGYLGDYNNDGNIEIVVGAHGSDITASNSNEGSVYILSIDSNGKAAGIHQISEGINGFNENLSNGSRFGVSVSDGEDIDGDGYIEFLVGAWFHDETSTNDGGAWLISIDSFGYAFQYNKIANGTPGFGTQNSSGDLFGTSVAFINDINGDGVTDIGISARENNDGGTDRGAVYVMFTRDTCCPVIADFIASDSNACLGETINFTNTSSGVTAPNYTWSINDSIVSTSTNFSFQFNEVGSYLVKLYVDDSCDRSHFQHIVVHPNPTADAGSSGYLCPGDSVQLGASGGEYYQWNNASSLTNDTISDPFAYPSVTTVYVVTVTDTNGCSDIDNLAIILHPQPSISVTGDTFICHGDSSQLIASGGVSYAWTPTNNISDSTGNPLRAKPTETTTYVVHGTDANGCIGSDSITVILDNANAMLSFSDTTIEIGTALSITNAGSSGDSVAWSLDSVLISNDTVLNHTFSNYGHFILYLYTSDSCSSMDSAKVHVIPLANCVTATEKTKISNTQGNFNAVLSDGSRVGQAQTGIGDINNDGVPDIAIGNPIDSDGQTNAGAVYIMFLKADGSVESYTKISNDSGNLGSVLPNNAAFGHSIESVGDLNNDGYVDIAVGSPGDDEQGTNKGAIWILFLDSIGNVADKQKISDLYGGLMADISDNSNFGSILSNIGDINLDGNADLLAQFNQDSLIILFLKDDGTVLKEKFIGGLSGNWPSNIFESYYYNGEFYVISDIACEFGDFNSDGFSDFVMVHPDSNHNNLNASDSSSFSIISLDTFGNVVGNAISSLIEKPHDASNGHLDSSYSAVTNMGDLNDDGFTEFVVGYHHMNGGEDNNGGFILLSIDSSGNVYNQSFYSEGIGPIDFDLDYVDILGLSVENIGDVNGDGLDDVSIGAPLDDDGGGARGALYIIPFQDSCCPVIADFNQTDSILCLGDSVSFSNTSTGTISPSFEWFVNDSLVSTSANMSYVFNQPGYNVVRFWVTDTCRRMRRKTFYVNENTTGYVSVDTAICIGDTAELIAYGGAQYQWNNGASLSDDTIATPLAYPTAATQYIVTITDSNTCEKMDTVEVDVNVLPAIVALGDSLICLNDSASIYATGGIDYFWTPNYFASDTVGDSIKVSPPVNTKYYVYGQDSNSCWNSDSILVELDTSLLVSVNSTLDVACFADSTGKAFASATGGTLPYAFAWSNGSNVDSIINVPSGTYFVTVQDTNGCIDSTNIFIDQSDSLYSSTTQTDVLCFGDSTGIANVFPSGGTTPYSYSWNSGSTISTATDLPAGNYTVLVTDSHACEIIDSVTITQPNMLVVSITLDSNVSCFGGNDASATASAVGGDGTYSFAWSSGSGTATAHNLSAGTYLVTVTDNNSCTDTASITITEPTVLVVSLVEDSGAVCNGDSNAIATATVTGGTTAYSYLWDNGETTATATMLYAGNRSVTVTDAKGCTDTETVTISEPTPVSVSLNSLNASCHGFTDGWALASGSGGTGAFSYNWSNSSSIDSTTNLGAGTYTVTASDANGCTIVDSIEITHPDELIVTVDTFTDAICYGESNGSALASSIGGTPAYEYLWTNGDTTTNLTNLDSGLHVVMVTDSQGCVALDSVDISHPTLLVASIALDSNVSCFNGSDGSATASGSGGIQPYSYAWSSGSNNAIAPNLTAGMYIVTVTDSNNCTDTASIEVTQPIVLDVSLVEDNSAVCNGDSNAIATATVTGGTAAYTYLWDNGETAATATMLYAGTRSVTVTDSKGCMDSATVVITEPTQVELMISSVNASCDTFSDGWALAFGFEGTGAFTYAWSNGSTIDSATNLSAGTYTVTASDANGCSIVDSVEITEPELLVVTIDTFTDVLCYNGSDGTASASTIGGTFAYSYAWSNGSTFSNPIDLDSGLHVVTVTDAQGCVALDSVVIDHPTLLVASIALDSNVSCFTGSDASATASGAGGSPSYSYAWSSGSANAIAPNLTAGNYIVTVTDSNNCQDTASIVITEPQVLSVTATKDSGAVCYGDSNAIASTAVTGGTASYSYSWDNGETTSVATELYAGIRKVIVTDAKGCTAVDSVAISEPSPVIAIFDSVKNVICNGFYDGLAFTSAVGGTGSHYFNWNTGDTLDDIDSLTSGTYVLSVTDDNACLDTLLVSVVELNPVIPVVSQTNVTCFSYNDGAATSTVSGGGSIYSHEWSNGPTTTFLDSLVADTYVLTITDEYNCYGTDTAHVTQPDSIQFAFTVDDALCQSSSDGQVHVGVMGGTLPYSLLWSTGGNDTVISGLDSGLYHISIVDSNGCTNADSVLVSDPEPLIVSTMLIDSVTCNGDTDGVAHAMPVGGVGDYSYLWSNGSTNDTIDSIWAQSYSVTVTDTNLCTASDSITMLEPDSLLSGTDSLYQLLCHLDSNGFISIWTTGGNGGNTYAWSNGSTDSLIDSLPDGVYTVTITDFKNCQSIHTDSMVQPDTLMAQINYLTELVCKYDSNGAIDAIVTGGTIPYSFAWNTGDSLDTLIALIEDTFALTVTDHNGCTDTASFALWSTSDLGVTIDTFNHLTCFNDSTGYIQISADSGVGSYIYSWSNGISTPINQDLLGDTYSFTVTDSVGCIDSGQIEILEPTLVTINSFELNKASCDNTADGDAYVITEGGTGIRTVYWPDSFTGDTNANITSGSYLIYVQDENGCTAYDTVTVGYRNASPIIELGPDTATCDLKSIDIGISDIYPTMLWSDGSIENITTVKLSGKYSLTVTDDSNCSAFDHRLVQMNRSTYFSLSADTLICQDAGLVTWRIGQDVKFEHYLWSTGSIEDSIDISRAGTYWLTAWNEFNCASSDSIRVAFDLCDPFPPKCTFQELLAYPVPTRDMIHLETCDQPETVLQYTVYDLNGHVVDYFASFDRYNDLDISHYAAGVYVIRMVGLNVSARVTIVKL